MGPNKQIVHAGQPVSTTNPLPVTLAGGTAGGTPVPVASVGYESSKSVTRPSNTTAYTAGDVIGIADAGTPANAGSAILELANLGPAGGDVVVDKVELTIELNAVPSGMANFRAHFYNASPTAILDNAAFDLPVADDAKHLGWVDIVTPEDLGSVLKSSAIPLQSFRLAPGQTSLWVILETRGGYTPASGTVYKLRATAKLA
jgi:hypothetical protein